MFTFLPDFLVNMSGKNQLGLVIYGYKECLVENNRSLSCFRVIKQKQTDYNDAGQWIMNIGYVEFLLSSNSSIKIA